MAPGAANGHTSYRMPGASQVPGMPSAGRPAVRLPSVDNSLARPEVIDSEIGHALPADPPHGDPHCRIDSIIAGNAREGCVASWDMFPRTDKKSVLATDTSIRKGGVHPKTGSRYLKELAFEVVNDGRSEQVAPVSPFALGRVHQPEAGPPGPAGAPQRCGGGDREDVSPGAAQGGGGAVQVGPGVAAVAAAAPSGPRSSGATRPPGTSPDSSSVCAEPWSVVGLHFRPDFVELRFQGD